MDIVAEAGSYSAEDLELQLFYPDQVNRVWDDFVQLLLQSRHTWEEHFTIESIGKLAVEGKCQLWTVSDDGGIYLGAITEIIEYPTKRSLKIIWLGGRHLARSMAFLGYIEIWAKRGGCETIEVLGRPGWLRVLKPYDYREKAVYLEKDISSLVEM